MASELLVLPSSKRQSWLVLHQLLVLTSILASSELPKHWEQHYA